jgi:transcriptional regulator with XRE-family HTH domain
MNEVLDMDESKTLALKLGNKIRLLRNQRGLTLEQLALRCDMAPNFLGNVERGMRCPTVHTIQRVCNGLNISLAELFTDEDSSSEKAASIEHIRHAIEPLSVKQTEQIVAIVDAAVALLEQP